MKLSGVILRAWKKFIFLSHPSSFLIFDTSHEASDILKRLNAEGTEKLALNSDRGRHVHIKNLSPKAQKMGFIGHLCSLFLTLVLLGRVRCYS